MRPASTVERGSRIRLAAIRSATMGVLPILAIFLGARVRGAPMFVYYSYEPSEGVEFVRALTEIRWQRIGTWIR